MITILADHNMEGQAAPGNPNRGVIKGAVSNQEF